MAIYLKWITNSTTNLPGTVFVDLSGLWLLAMPLVLFGFRFRRAAADWEGSAYSGLPSEEDYSKADVSKTLDSFTLVYASVLKTLASTLQFNNAHNWSHHIRPLLLYKTPVMTSAKLAIAITVTLRSINGNPFCVRVTYGSN